MMLQRQFLFIPLVAFVSITQVLTNKELVERCREGTERFRKLNGGDSLAEDAAEKPLTDKEDPCDILNDFEARIPNVKEIEVTHDELSKTMSSIVLIDVRKAEELQVDAKIPKAVNIPLDELGAALKLPPATFKSNYGIEKPLDDADNIVFQSRIGVRSLSAVMIAREAGYTKVRHYQGGIVEWLDKAIAKLRQKIEL